MKNESATKNAFLLDEEEEEDEDEEDGEELR